MRTDRPARPGPAGRRRPPAERAPLRLASGSEIVYGRNAVAEALRGPRRARRLFVAEGVRDDERVRAILARAAELGLPVERPFRQALDQISQGANHQGVVLEASPYPYVALDDIAGEPRTVVVLDHLQDPQNFGTLLRAAEASGVAGVIIPQDRAVAVTAAVVNASAGAVEHLKVARVPNLARAADLLKEVGWWLVGLDTGPDAVDLFDAELPSPVALVVGGEASGIGPNLRRRCDVIASLPMRGRVASLNAATAASIALFELLRRSESRQDAGTAVGVDSTKSDA